MYVCLYISITLFVLSEPQIILERHMHPKCWCWGGLSTQSMVHFCTYAIYTRTSTEYIQYSMHLVPLKNMCRWDENSKWLPPYSVTNFHHFPALSAQFPMFSCPRTTRRSPSVSSSNSVIFAWGVGVAPKGAIESKNFLYFTTVMGIQCECSGDITNHQTWDTTGKIV